MSGCYDNYDYCGYDNNCWDYDPCYKPRHHRRRYHRECWDYSSSCN